MEGLKFMCVGVRVRWVWKDVEVSGGVEELLKRVEVGVECSCTVLRRC